MIVDLKGGTALITGAASGIGAAGAPAGRGRGPVTGLDLDAPGC
jgi:NAD(P)-dependent dehydrogenase (short-subunit alcohol dehydrogenase family)